MTMKLFSYKRIYGSCTPPPPKMQTKTNKKRERERGSMEKVIECELTSAKLYSIGEYIGSVCTNE